MADSNNIDCFPLKSRVVLHGLVKAPELNNKIGVVTSALNSSGRQTVSLVVEDGEEARTVGLKPANLKFEGRSVDSLSIKELKKVLLAKDVDEKDITGIDKADLKSKVENLVDSPEEIAKLLVIKSGTNNNTSTASSSSSAFTNNNNNIQQAANDFANMDPNQLQQQAMAMKSMPPSQIRRMNPQLAHMTDDQIRMAANQMEMMANNPHMMQMAKEQMSNMSPEQLEQMKNGNMNMGMPSSSSGTTSSSSTAATPNANPQQAAQMMSDMSPEQLRYQAQMLKTMPPDQLRRTNPQLAHMTDEQIKMAASQFEMMANNPELAKMATEQMKNMTPEQIEQMQKEGAGMGMGGLGGGAGAAGGMMGDPSKMMANMDKKQLKQMMASVKDNPEMLKQFAKMSGMPEEQLKQQVEMFAGMDDAKLDMALGAMQKVQQAKEIWTGVDKKTGGNLKYIMIFVVVVLVGLVVKLLFFRDGGLAGTTTTTTTPIPGVPKDIPSNIKMTVVSPDDEEDEFGGGEF